jgi:FAD/FMN-containing dehydrogenase
MKIGPYNARYDRARRHWSGMIDPRCPGIIVRRAATADVVRSIHFARGNELAIAGRAGGHSIAFEAFSCPC